MLEPHIKCSAKDVSPYVIIVGMPERAKRIAEEFLSNSKLISSYRGFLIYKGDYEGKTLTVASTGIGGPSAGIVTEELINCGAKIIIRVGSGGVMKKEINTGDIVISTGVCKEENSTKAYVPHGFAAVPNYDVLNALINSAKESGSKFFYGPTMCTDAFYAKSHRDKMIEWSKIGVIGSEMESSILFTIAQLRGVKAGMIFYGGLNVIKKEPYANINKQEALRREGERKAIMIALKAVKKLMEVKN